MNQNEIEVIGLVELIGILKKNLHLILLGVFVGLMIGVGFSAFRDSQQQVINQYSLTTLVSVDTLALTEESIAMINFTLSHPENVLKAQRKLNISGKFDVKSTMSEEEGVLLLKVEGDNGPELTRLSRELFNISKPIVESALIEVEIRKLEVNSPIIISTTTLNQANWVLYTIVGVFMGGIISLLYIFGHYFLSPIFISTNELQRLFNAPMIGQFTSSQKNSFLKRIFEVRL